MENSRMQHLEDPQRDHVAPMTPVSDGVLHFNKADIALPQAEFGGPSCVMSCQGAPSPQQLPTVAAQLHYVNGPDRG